MGRIAPRGATGTVVVVGPDLEDPTRQVTPDPYPVDSCKTLKKEGRKKKKTKKKILGHYQ